MIKELFPDLLRSVVTDIMFVIFLSTMAQPKCNRKTLLLLNLLPVIVDTGACIYFYLHNDYTSIAKFEVVFIAMLCLVSKPLFRDTVMQWIFNFITALNFFLAIVVLSYLYSRSLPYPAYAHTVLRFILFAALIVLFHYYVRPLYRRVAEHWSIFLLTALVLFINLSYFLIINGDIVESMTSKKIPLLLLIVLMIVVYLTMFITFKVLIKEYALREENLYTQSREDLLRVQMNAMQQRLHMIDETNRKNRIAAHDRRHLNNTLLELLRQCAVDEAIAHLEQVSAAPTVTDKCYCENSTINATVAYYAAIAQNENIRFKTQLDIPDILLVDVLEFSICIGNLLENAIHACEKLLKDQERYINFTCFCNGQLVFEIENPYTGELILDSKGFPTSLDKNHGIGIKSILAFADKHGAQLRYTAENGVFRVRALI